MKICLIGFALILSSSVHAEDGSTLLFYCDPGEPRVHLATADNTDQAQNFHNSKPELINVSALITYSKEDQYGVSYRRDSASIRRSCGRVSVKISGGYFNSNTQGELGAAPDYPLVEIFEGSKLLAGPLAIGSCDASNGRYNVFAECPKAWATEVTIFEGASRDGGLVVHLSHTYDEYPNER